MGKINCHDKTRFIAAAVLCILLLVSAVYAADPEKEFELFDQGYKDYLSYQPEKAAGEFRMFLREFPSSSASDAVMFWLGKSLMQLKSFEEAKQIFADIKQQFPDSPFVRYADKELDGMKRVSGFARTVPDTVSETRIADNVAVKKAKTDDQVKIREKETQKIPEQKKESKSVPPQEEISKKAETPVEPAVAAVSGRPSPAASTLEQKVIYSVQVGVFKRQRKADVLGAEFKREGYTVKVRKGTLHGEDVFKVLVGKFAGKSEAEAIAGKLKRIYRLNTMVTGSEAGEEVQIAQEERLKEAGDSDRLRSLSGQEEKRANVLSAEGGKIRGEGQGPNPLPEKEEKGTSKKDETLAASGGSADRVETLQSPTISKKGVVYSVQIGVFGKQKTTDRLKSEFEKDGYPVKITKGTSKGRDVFKVLVGQFADKNDAKSAARAFEKKYGGNTIVSMSEARDEIPAARVDFVKAAGDRGKPRSSSEPAEKKTAKMAATTTQTGSKDSEVKGPGPESPEQAKKQEETAKHPEGLKAENELLSTPIQPPKDEKSKTDDEQKNVKSDASGSDLPAMEIKNIKYTARDVPEYTAASQSLCDKLQIKEILWRSGNDNEDFLNEQVLYDESKSLHITADKNELTEMIENYQLDDREADYLQRYLAISGLIERKIKAMPEEKVVEAIMVRYEESDRYMKIVLGSELQNLARKGTSFEEIYRLYPDIVSFSVIGFPELEKRMKEKIQSLQDNEIVVTWSEDGYMILKPVFKGPVFRPFGDISPGLRDRIRTYVLSWIKGLREKY